MWTPVCMEPLLGYHPCGAGFLTRGREPVWGQCQVLLYMIRENAGRQVIYDGLARLASGQLDYKIDEKDLTGDNRQMAAAVNRVGEGLQNAVKETLKSERLKADLITNVSHDIKISFLSRLALTTPSGLLSMM